MKSEISSKENIEGKQSEAMKRYERNIESERKEKKNINTKLEEATAKLNALNHENEDLKTSLAEVRTCTCYICHLHRCR